MENIIDARGDSWQRTGKAILDRLIAVILIIILAPLLIAISLGIKLQSAGPIIFQQDRHGRNNSVFKVWKFRSMHLKEAEDSGAKQAQREDPRTTRFGSFLRRTSLDELPQLVNVLQGKMSLVGPRPHPVWLDERYEHLVTSYADRYRVKPGITGWAQVNGLRGPVAGVAAMQTRVEHDNYYIDNWSLLLDLKILLMTLRLGILNKNAY